MYSAAAGMYKACLMQVSTGRRCIVISVITSPLPETVKDERVRKCTVMFANRDRSLIHCREEPASCVAKFNFAVRSVYLRLLCLAMKDTRD